ncbi:CHAT domain-containing protein [Cyanobacteria bacterium FACHB-502]|nr:CHAT domain-containing protein [Cyanobacteria bacterium FACHB-502]
MKLMRYRWKFLKLASITVFSSLIALGVHLLTPETLFAAAADPAHFIQEGRQHYQAGQFYDATRKLEQSAQIYADRHNVLNQAIALTYLALSYQQLGEVPLAQTTIAQSLSLVPPSGGSQSQQQVRAQALTAQGQIQLASGQPEQALESWQQARADYQTLGDEIGQLGTQINQIQALRSIGYYRQAQNQIETLESNLTRSPEPELQMLGWRSLGNLLRTLGQLDQSRAALEESWRIAQAQPSQLEQSAVLLSLGNTETALGDQQLNRQLIHQRDDCASWSVSEGALQHYQQAVAHYQQSAVQSPATLLGVTAQLNALSLQLKLRQPIALEELQQIRAQLDQLPTSRSTIFAKINFAKNTLCYSQSTSIFSPDVEQIVTSILESAVQQAKALGDDRAHAYALGTLGQIEEVLTKLPEAQQKTAEALGIARQVRASDIAYQWEWQMARILRQTGETQQALNYYQAAFNTLKELRSDLTVLDTDLQFSFRETVEPFYREYVDLLLVHNPTQPQLQQSRAVIEALQLAELDDFFRDACSNAKPELLDQVADQQDPSAAIVYTILLSDRLEIILKLPQQEELQHYVTYENEPTIISTLQELRNQLELPYTINTLKQPAAQLYGWLIKPIETALLENKIQTLVFTLDSGLRNIPVAALFNGEQYLIENYAVAVTPGLQLLEPRPLQQIRPRLLAGGLAEPNPEVQPYLGPLAGVPDELAAIQAVVPRSVELLNDEFTKEKVEEVIQSQPMSIVHLATHGRFSSNLTGTFILTHNAPVNVNELQVVLQNRSATDLDAIELLVLSACDTAKGDDRATLGMAGIAVRSGARSTLASLWKANDKATAELIRKFYEQIFRENAAINKAAALRAAQLFLLRNPDFQHPRNWAHFVLLGNWL